MLPTCFLFAGLALLGQAETLEKAAPETDVIARFTKFVAEYDMRLDSAPNEKLKLLDKPILRWGNPARTNEDGAMYLWLRNGRPEAIGSIFTYKLARVRTKNELHSLARGPLTARFREDLAWKPPTAGVEFAPVEDAPVPADSPRLRLIQMRQMASQFTGDMVDAKERRDTLRFLNQPLYRYDPTTKGVLDGAIFALVLGTDPEVLVILEARDSAAGKRWEFACARFHYNELTVKRGDRVVFHADLDTTQGRTNLGDPASRDKTYVTFHVDGYIDATVPQP
jgi:hypothetical protein